MLEDFYRFVASEPWYSAALALIPGLAGIVAGHRLTIARDQRTEYNAIADQVRSRLISMRGARCPCIADIGESDWDLLYRRAGRVQAARLRKALQRAKDAETSGTAPDPLNQPIFTDPAAMTAERERLIALLKHR